MSVASGKRGAKKTKPISVAELVERSQAEAGGRFDGLADAIESATVDRFDALKKELDKLRGISYLLF